MDIPLVSEFNSKGQWSSVEIFETYHDHGGATSPMVVQVGKGGCGGNLESVTRITFNA